MVNTFTFSHKEKTMNKDDLYPILDPYIHKDTPMNNFSNFINDNWEILQRFNHHSACSLFKHLFEESETYSEDKQAYSEVILNVFNNHPKEELFLSMCEAFFDFAIITSKYNNKIANKVDSELSEILNEQQRIVNGDFSKKSDIKTTIKNIDSEIANNEKNIGNAKTTEDKDIGFGKRKKLGELKPKIQNAIIENVRELSIDLGLSHCYSNKEHLIWLNESTDKFKQNHSLCSSQLDAQNHTHPNAKYVTCKACINKAISLYQIRK
tara:strand:- start:22898 stop:23695 length:798 start_codon:yes stop_codon:yes gene_type:complete